MPIPQWLRAFVDDAAIFPPGDAPLEQAVADHAEHRASAYGALIGGFVVSDTRLPDLTARLAADEEGGRGPSRDLPPLEVNLVVTGGAGAVEPAVTWASGADGLRLRAVEFALRDEDDLARNARRLVSVVDSLGEVLDDVVVYAEPPPASTGAGWLGALDELAAREVHLKLRTGGVSAEAFPAATTLAAGVGAALDRELPFKCTAGLHRAVRHRDDATGFEHHGFLNVLLATRVALDGGTVADVAHVLEVQGADALAARLSQDAEENLRTRRWFESFGSCAVLEAHEDLVELGLVDE